MRGNGLPPDSRIFPTLYRRLGFLHGATRPLPSRNRVDRGLTNPQFEDFRLSKKSPKGDFCVIMKMGDKNADQKTGKKRSSRKGKFR